MNEATVGQYWDANAEAWTALTRAGYDIYRDQLNTPAFFGMLPDVAGLSGLDIGCGEGHNTRLLARQGAIVTAVDISGVFLAKAQEAEAAEPLGISYLHASAGALPFPDGHFDFATSFMCLMDVPDAPAVLRQAYRVLRPGGFFQFSISHPCFETPHRKNLRGGSGHSYAVEIGGYFDRLHGRVDEWIFSSAPEGLREAYPKFKVPRFHYTLSGWVNMLVEAGFSVEEMGEPSADEETVRAWPALQDTQVWAFFLHFRCRKR